MPTKPNNLKYMVAIPLVLIALNGSIPDTNLKPTTNATTTTSSSISSLSSSSSSISSSSTVNSQSKSIDSDRLAITEAVEKPNKKSKYLNTVFGKSNKKTGQEHWEQCTSTEAGLKFLEAFEEFGIDNQVIACATLNYENGSHDLFTRGVCNAKYQEGGDYRRCVYADINSAGLDIGLFQINTYYQAKRITKLAGKDYSCNFTNSRDWSDTCNKKKAEWLFNIDNQLVIIKDIYKESGFQPWSAYLSNVKPYI